MRIGKKRAKFTIRIYDNASNKTRSFVFDNAIKSVEKLAHVIKTLLEQHYSFLSEYKYTHVCKKCGMPYGSIHKKDNGKCPKCTYEGGRNKK